MCDTEVLKRNGTRAIIVILLSSCTARASDIKTDVLRRFII